MKSIKLLKQNFDVSISSYIFKFLHYKNREQILLKLQNLRYQQISQTFQFSKFNPFLPALFVRLLHFERKHATLEELQNFFFSLNDSWINF